VLDFVINLINFVTYRIFKLNNEKYLIFASRWKYRKKLSEKVVQNPILMFILLEFIFQYLFQFLFLTSSLVFSTLFKTHLKKSKYEFFIETQSKLDCEAQPKHSSRYFGVMGGRDLFF
jgi:hypothetical protein